MTEDSVGEDEFFGIGEVLEILLPEFDDLSISKIRFLEAQGLIEPQRTYSGFRKFYKKDIERLKWILEQQRDHFLPLKVIKQKLKDIELSQEPTPLAKIAELKKTSRKHKSKTSNNATSRLPLKPADFLEQSEIEQALSSIYNDLTGNAITSVDNDKASIIDGDTHDDIKIVEFDESEETISQLTYLNRATSHIDQIPTATYDSQEHVISDSELLEAQQSSDNLVTYVLPNVSTDIRGNPLPEIQHNTNSLQNDRSNPVYTGDSSAGISSAGDPNLDNRSTVKNVSTSLSESSSDSNYYLSEEVEAGSTYSSTSEIEEFALSLNCKSEMVQEMIDLGFIEPDNIAGVSTFGRDCYEIAKTILTYQKHGFELRHLKILLNAAERESGLYLQVLRPILRRRNPNSKYEARELGQILMRAGAKLHQELLRRELRKELKG